MALLKMHSWVLVRHQQRVKFVQDNKHNSFDWNRQWYPLGAIRDLNPSRPTSAMLLGKSNRQCHIRSMEWKES